MKSRVDLESELARLRKAATPTVESFRASRARRIAELEATIETMPDDPPPPDPKVEKALRNTAGGDQFDRKR
jgi:hypothetical protein